MIEWDEVSESTAGADRRPEDEWIALLRRHLLSIRRWSNGAPPKIVLPDARTFRGRIRSGHLGTLRYCHLDTTPHVFLDEGTVPSRTDGHMVVFQVRGTSNYSSCAQKFRLQPGSILFIANTPTLRVEHENNVEQIALVRPVPGEDKAALWRHPLHLSEGANGLPRMVFRWVTDACLANFWNGCGAADDVAHTLSRLVTEVLRSTGATEPGSNRLTRARLQDFMAHHLRDPALSIASAAQAFGCSVRTLHRVFRCDGAESFERCLWRMRLHECATALRAPHAANLSFAELALNWGFSSATHFSGLFRKTFGETPSQYRQRHRRTEVGLPTDA